jgi:hypothetical protein
MSFRDWTWTVGGGETAMLLVISKAKLYLIVNGELKRVATFNKEQLKVKRHNVLQSEI